MAMKTGKMKSVGNVDSVFVFRGYSNWKDASGERGALNNCECSTVHKNAVELVVTLPVFTRDVGESCCLLYMPKRRGPTDSTLH